MSNDNFFSIDRLVEFGLGVAVAQQMAASMNKVLQSTSMPGAMTPMAGMPQRFFAMLDGNQAGPFSEDELAKLISSGQVSRGTYVWKPGMSNWLQAEKVPDVLRIVALVPPPFKPEE
jgi:hypothetical protein